jgi:hypothetical protein
LFVKLNYWPVATGLLIFRNEAFEMELTVQAGYEPVGMNLLIHKDGKGGGFGDGGKEKKTFDLAR